MLDETPPEPVGQAMLRDPQLGDWIVIIQDGKEKKITVAAIEPEKIIVHEEKSDQPKEDGSAPPEEIVNQVRKTEPAKVVVHIEEEGEQMKWDSFSPPGEFSKWARQFEITEASR